MLNSVYWFFFCEGDKYKKRKKMNIVFVILLFVAVSVASEEQRSECWDLDCDGECTEGIDQGHYEERFLVFNMGYTRDFICDIKDCKDITYVEIDDNSDDYYHCWDMDRNGVCTESVDLGYYVDHIIPDDPYAGKFRCSVIACAMSNEDRRHNRILHGHFTEEELDSLYKLLDQ